MQPNTQEKSVLLLEAASRGYTDEIRLLIADCVRLGITIDPVNDVGSTPLHLVTCYHSHNLALIELLIHAGANVNAKNQDGATPLSCVCNQMHSDIEAVKLLIKANADVNAQSKKGYTLLHRLTQYVRPRYDVIELLVSSGADMNMLCENSTPLHYLSCSRDAEVVQFMGKYLEILDVNKVNSSGYTPLITAIVHNNYKLALFLINAGCDVNIRSARGNTALRLIASHLPSAQIINIIKKLLLAGADDFMEVLEQTNSECLREAMFEINQSKTKRAQSILIHSE